MKWEIEIKGSKSDLEYLAKQYNTDKISIVQKGDKFLLKSKNFDSLSNKEDVKEEAIKLLKRINGIIKLSSNILKPVECDRIYQLDEDGNTIKTFQERTANFNIGIVSMECSIEVKNLDGKIIHNQENAYITWEKLAEKYKSVNDVLQLISDDFDSWFTLYKITEILEQDQFKPIMRDGAYRSEIERLQYTANSVKAIGNKARHHKESMGIPKVPMQFSEAKSLIKKILKEWRIEKERIYLDNIGK